MATGYGFISFIDVCQNSFYFHDLLMCFSCCVFIEAETELDVDDFRKKKQPPMKYWIQSLDRRFLVLNASEELEFWNKNAEERKQADCQFNIRLYQSSEKEDMLPVIIYAKCQNKEMVVCCCNDTDVRPETMDLIQLEKIRGTGHKALFYRKNITNDKYTLESTLYRGRFLSFETDQENSFMHKLILRPQEDEVDESCRIIMSKIK